MRILLLIIFVVCTCSACTFANVFNANLDEVDKYFEIRSAELHALESLYLWRSVIYLERKLGNPNEKAQGFQYGLNSACPLRKCNCQAGTCVQKISDEVWTYVFPSGSVLFYIEDNKVVRIKN